MCDEVDNSEKCPHCHTRNEDHLEEINGSFITEATREPVHIYWCRNCGLIYGSDY